MPRSVPSPLLTGMRFPCDLCHEELRNGDHSPAFCVINVLCHDLYLSPFEQACVSPAICAMRNSALMDMALVGPRAWCAVRFVNSRYACQMYAITLRNVRNNSVIAEPSCQALQAGDLGCLLRSLSNPRQCLCSISFFL